METQVLEGTLAEIKRQLHGLPYAPDLRVRVTIEEAEPPAATKRTRNGITLVPVKNPERQEAEMPATNAEPFRPAEFRNGVPLLPRRKTAEPVTTEFVKRLLDEEDEERFRADRTAGR
jgi:hypothetical protein